MLLLTETRKSGSPEGKNGKANYKQILTDKTLQSAKVGATPKCPVSNKLTCDQTTAAEMQTTSTRKNTIKGLCLLKGPMVIRLSGQPHDSNL